MEYKLFRIHLALFFLDILRDPYDISQKIVKKLNFFGNDIQYIEGPYTPYYENKSADGKLPRYSFSTIQDRCDFTLYAHDDPEDILKDFKSKCHDVLQAVFAQKQIGRIGLVKYFFKETEHPQKDIISRYIKQKTINNADEIYIRYNNRSKFENIAINHVRTIDSSPHQKNNISGVTLTSDINTLFCTNGITIEYAKSFIKEFLLSK